MSNKSERAYYWIDARANSFSKWIDSNRGRLLLIAIFAWLGIWGLFLEGRDELDTVRRLVRGMGPELAGIVIAAVTINALAERRQEQEHKAQLIRQLGSKYRDVTEMAIIELRHKGWLEDGSLNKADLRQADLSQADLTNADLSGTYLMMANLSGALLGRANLSRAYLGNADLSGAYLWDANLSQSRLWQTNLCKAYFEDTNLKDAYLGKAILSEAQFLAIPQLEEAESLEGATMQDGVQLGYEPQDIGFQRIEGPTFEEWKMQFLAKHEGTMSGYREHESSEKV